ncbi:unnamed protein product [Adineta steineri]|uniref:Fibronectin type-III domain-containing protein n=1 Tax=Adineta steineri TaxID=433720 RepID=A0A819QQP6_9BILA|nr:unnamed protein product [Adineta steineri]CAF4028093.1 unnamed protein product [Adineta steineri]
MAMEHIITMATLGRSFHLGTLYDVRSDKLITNVTLWTPRILEDHTNIYKQSYADYEIITEDSFQDKARALGVKPNLKLSLLSGLFNVSGSAEYADDYQKTNLNARVTLKYSITTHFQQLTMKHLGKGNLDHPSLRNKNLATHVVTDVLYGTEAFFVFDRTISNGKFKNEISGKLKAIIDNLIFKADEGAKLKLTNEEEKIVNKWHCRFYGDFPLNQTQINLVEAVKIYRRLSSLLGVSNENAVPKEVWLHPLSPLGNNLTKIVRQISSSLIDHTIKVIEDLRYLEIRSLDLSTSKIFTHLDYMKIHLLNFAVQLSEMRHALRKKIALTLPAQRGNTNMVETFLLSVSKEVDSSPFSRRPLKSWLKEKEAEITIITKWIQNLSKDKSLDILIKSSSLDEVINDTRYDYIFCLSFRLVEQSELQIIDMKKYLHNMENYLHNKKNFKSSTIRKKHKTWFENSHDMKIFDKSVQQFKEFAQGNNIKNSRIKFIVNEKYAVNHNKTVKLILYNNGSEISGFIMPSKPAAPYAISITDNSVTLTWTDESSGSENVQKYKVMYQKYHGKNQSKEEEQWSEEYTNGNYKNITISNLPSSTKFIFKVQAITAIGLSAISARSEPMETFANNETKSDFEGNPNGLMNQQHNQSFSRSSPNDSFVRQSLAVQERLMNISAITYKLAIVPPGSPAENVSMIQPGTPAIFHLDNRTAYVPRYKTSLPTLSKGPDSSNVEFSTVYHPEFGALVMEPFIENPYNISNYGNYKVTIYSEDSQHIIAETMIGLVPEIEISVPKQFIIHDSINNLIVNGIVTIKLVGGGAVAFNGTTDHSGMINLPDTLADGTYEVEIYSPNKPNLQQLKFFMVTYQNRRQEKNFSFLGRNNLKPNEIEIILRWGAQPRDLDSHLYSSDGKHIYFSNRNETNMALDYDVTRGYGPETTRFTIQPNLKYIYVVHRYSNESMLTKSKAELTVNIDTKTTHINKIRRHDNLVNGEVYKIPELTRPQAKFWIVCMIDGSTKQIKFFENVFEDHNDYITNEIDMKYYTG